MTDPEGHLIGEIGSYHVVLYTVPGRPSFSFSRCFELNIVKGGVYLCYVTPQS